MISEDLGRLVVLEILISAQTAPPSMFKARWRSSQLCLHALKLSKMLKWTHRWAVVTNDVASGCNIWSWRIYSIHKRLKIHGWWVRLDQMTESECSAESPWLWDGAAGAIDRDHGGLVISERLSGLWNADNGKAAITEKEERGFGKWELVSFQVTQAKWKQLCQLKHETSKHRRAKWLDLLPRWLLKWGILCLKCVFTKRFIYHFLIFDFWPHLVSAYPLFSHLK